MDVRVGVSASLCLLLLLFLPLARAGEGSLRIGLHWSDDATAKTGSEKERVDLLLQKAAARLSVIFTVSRSATPIKFNRSSDACGQLLNKGPLCAKLNTSYIGETCPGVPNFMIPDKFLAGLTLHSADNSSTPAFREGSGAANKDVIFFVTSQSMSECSDKVIIVGRHCRLHSSSLRPLAAVLNLCPRSLLSPSPQFFASSVRALLHGVGFDLPLLRRRLPSSFVKNGGRLFLRSSRVATFSQNHFACNKGVPVDASGWSLWDPVFMFSSVMAGDVSVDSSVDGATVAAFEDAGWFSVNYAKVDHFLWARKLGCQFDRACKDTGYFCPPPGSAAKFHKCDFLHRGSTGCPVVDPKRPRCRIRSLQERCQGNNEANVRCVSSGDSHETVCATVYCGNLLTKFAVILSGQVAFCQSTKSLIYLATKRLLCPEKAAVCSKPETLSTWMPRLPQATTTTSSPTKMTATKSRFKMRFATMSYPRLKFLGVLIHVAKGFVAVIARVLDCREQDVLVIGLRSGSVIVDFQITLPESTAQLLLRLQEATTSGRISVTVAGETYKASTVMKVDDDEVIEDGPGSHLTEIVVGTVLGFILCAAAIAIVVIFLIKYKLIHPQVSPEPPDNAVRPRSLETLSLGSRQTSATMTSVERPFSTSSIYFDGVDTCSDRCQQYEVSQA